MLFHKGYFLLTYHHILQAFELLPEQEVEALGVNLMVAVIESVLDFRPGISLEYVILASKSVQVVISEVFDYRFHIIDYY